MEAKWQTHLVSSILWAIMLCIKADNPSTIALNFSAALDDIFNLDSASDLARTVEQK